MTISLTLNGHPRSFDVDDDTPLLWVLREEAGQTGTKYGCGIGACGACTVHVDGAAARSCVTPVSAVADSSVVTIEGLAQSAGIADGGLHPLQRAWIENQVPQCGYCQTGMIMAAAALLKEMPEAGEDDVRAAISNICRCGTYPRIFKAIASIAQGDA